MKMKLLTVFLTGVLTLSLGSGIALAKTKKRLPPGEEQQVDMQQQYKIITMRSIFKQNGGWVLKSEEKTYRITKKSVVRISDQKKPAGNLVEFPGSKVAIKVDPKRPDEIQLLCFPLPDEIDL